MVKIDEASTKAGPGVLLPANAGSYSRNGLEKQFRNGWNRSLDRAEIQRFLEASAIGFDGRAIREGVFFAGRLREALAAWVHIQARRMEGGR